MGMADGRGIDLERDVGPDQLSHGKLFSKDVFGEGCFPVFRACCRVKMKGKLGLLFICDLWYDSPVEIRIGRAIIGISRFLIEPRRS